MLALQDVSLKLNLPPSDNIEDMIFLIIAKLEAIPQYKIGYDEMLEDAFKQIMSTNSE